MLNVESVQRICHDVVSAIIHDVKRRKTVSVACECAVRGWGLVVLNVSLMNVLAVENAGDIEILINLKYSVFCSNLVFMMICHTLFPSVSKRVS